MNDLMSKHDPWSFNWLVLSGLVVIAPHTARIPVWLTLVFAATLAWQWASIQRGWSMPPRLIRITLTFVLLIVTFKEYGTLLGRDAGTGLLVGLAGLKFLELRTLRDYTIITFIYYLLIGVNFLHEQELIHGAYLVATVFLTTATLVRLNLPTTNDWRYSLRLAGGMLVRALPLMLVMYLLFPRIHGGLWSLPTDARTGQTGLSSRITAGSISQLVQSEATAFRVEFEGDVPPPAQRYWRALALWKTDGKTWHIGPTTYIDPAKHKIVTTGDPVRYTVTLEASGKHWRPALDLPLQGDPGSRYRMGSILESKQRQNQRVRYQLESYPSYNTGDLSAYEKRLALSLPKNATARVRQLVNSWRENSSDQQVVDKALQHFGGQQFRYTLKPPLLGNKPVDEFLFQSQAGFCEHYATTFVYLMRLAGIPSRVVAGYQGGELNEGNNYLIVRQSDAHAWAEVWLKGKGWVRIDPTAAIAPERIEYGSEAIRMLEERGLRPGSLAGDALARLIELDFVESAWRSYKQAWDSINLAWFRWTTGYDIETQLELLKKLGVSAPGWLGLIVGLFAGIGLFIVAMLIGLKRSEREHDPLQSIYKGFETKLANRGIHRQPQEGPLDFCRRIADEMPTLKGSVNEITALYIQLRYNRSDYVPATELAGLRKQVRRFRPDKLLANAKT